MKLADQLPNIITETTSEDNISNINSGWYKFHDFIEESFDGNPRMVQVTYYKHHIDICNRVALMLSTIYEDDNEFLELNPDHLGAITISDMYQKIARALYPEDRIWYGEQIYAPAFWEEFFKVNNTDEASREVLWEKSWGPIPTV